VVYLYKLTDISQTEEVSGKKCIVNPQLPAGIAIALGTPLSVANVAIVPLKPLPSVIEVVVCAEPLGVGDNCL
jgi:hypothetical protein